MRVLILSLFCFLSLAELAALQYGKASYYADRFHGRKTASGIRHDNDDFVCAHRTAPFGSWLKVTNLKNEQVVFVKVTDRGPFWKNRIIDLSYSAAERIGMVKKGIVNVRVEAATNLDWLVYPQIMTPRHPEKFITLPPAFEEPRFEYVTPKREVLKKRRG